jgi:hypothetical protein
MVYVFGAGSAIVRVVKAGVTQARRIPTLKEVSVKFDGKLESQFGSAVYAEDAASGERKITGAIKFGAVGASLLNDIIFSGVRTAGTPKVVIDEGGVVGTAPTVNVVTIANLAGIAIDMGVISAVDGYPMDRVTSGVAAGQYIFDGSAGTYTFAAADPRAAFVRVSYRWTDTTVGATYEGGNPLQGTLADLELTLWKPRFTKHLGIIIYHAVLSGMDLSSKGSAYTDPSSNFEAFVDPALGSAFQLFGSEALD